MALTLAEAAMLLPEDAAMMKRLDEVIFAPVPIRRRPRGRAWICESGDHHYHRDALPAKKCAWKMLPFQQLVTVILGGDDAARA